MQELAPESPWNLYLGLGYALDIVPPPPIVEKVKIESVRVVARPVQPLFVLGKVTDRKTGAALERAVVRFEQTEFTALVTGVDGSFKTGSLEPGTYTFHISADNHEEGQCQALVPPRADSDSEVASAPVTLEIQCPLEPSPQLANVPGLLFDAESGSVIAGAHVKIEDRSGRALELAASSGGAFRFQNVPFGRVRISVDAPGYLLSVSELEVKTAELETLRLSLTPRPKKSNVVVSAKEVLLAKPVRFQPGSLQLLPGGEAILQELADVLRSRAELQLLEIRGYIDDTGSLSDALLLSQQRADAVRLALMRLGVEGARLGAKGAGEEETSASASPSERSKGRHVHFVIVMTDKKR